MDAETLRQVRAGLEKVNDALREAMATGLVQEEYLMLVGEHTANLKVIKNIDDWLKDMAEEREGKKQRLHEPLY